ncbi:hypothetical protein SAMN04487911_104157 [Arenibacter nanhaiticus]|uniref:Uncharacterized protein n=1 Tax=Arenibacter nanhaiticus TaxID=558155 RepID=A0A1M6D4F1_9FLAO|nr:hypothetical protein SAMN04487911_104157 [Arenibacter nanhaiticus]
MKDDGSFKFISRKTSVLTKDFFSRGKMRRNLFEFSNFANLIWTITTS